MVPMQHLFRSHSGDNVLPNFSLFARILNHAHQIPSPPAIKWNGTTVTYQVLCQDIVRMRQVLLRSANSHSALRRQSHQPVFYGLQAPGSYEFVVAFFAILACGGVVVPISPHAATKEIQHCVTTCGIQTILASNMKPTAVSNVTIIRISEFANQPEPPFPSIVLSCTDSLNHEEPGLAIFTSGTTGPPKGCILPREMLCSGTQNIADFYKITSDDTVLHCLPVHHAAGILISILPYLQSGACVEFSSGTFSESFVWQRWQSGETTAFTGVPTMYSRLMSYFESHLALQPPAVCQSYLEGLRGLRLLMSGTSALPRPLRMKWTQLTGGNRILERYGTTEFSAIFLIHPADVNSVPDGSVGRILPGVDVKLSNGNEGEILVKSPAMFTEYYGRPDETINAHDAQGYYLTGDIARREGPFYFILGRQSTDILKSGGYKISALDVERELLGLEYVSETAVVGVADEEFGQRVAAAVILKTGLAQSTLSLDRLRSDLRSNLAGYKLPTMLYVAEELPKTAMGKIQKKALLAQVFENPARANDIQIWRKTGKSDEVMLRARL